MYVATWAFVGYLKITPSLDTGAREAAARDADDGAACEKTLLVADMAVVAGGLGAPMVREVGLIGYLIELHDKSLNPHVVFQGGILGYG